MPQSYTYPILLKAQTNSYPIDFLILDLASLLFVFYYLIISYIYVKRFNTKIKQLFSNIEQISATWIQEFFGVYTLLVFISYIPLIINADLKYFLVFLPISSIILYLYLVYKSLNNSLFFSNTITQVLEEDNKNSYEQSSYKLQAIESNDLSTIIEHAMIQKKLYTDKDLNIQKFANECNIKTHILSAFINSYYNKNFYDFINYYRIQESLKLLSSNASQKYTIETIAGLSGFHSRSAFYKSFNKITNMSPRDYLKD